MESKCITTTTQSNLTDGSAQNNSMKNIKSELSTYSIPSIATTTISTGSKKKLNLKTELELSEDSHYLSVNQITNGTLGSDLA